MDPVIIYMKRFLVRFLVRFRIQFLSVFQCRNHGPLGSRTNFVHVAPSLWSSSWCWSWFWSRFWCWSWFWFWFCQVGPLLWFCLLLLAVLNSNIKPLLSLEKHEEDQCPAHTQPVLHLPLPRGIVGNVGAKAELENRLR